MTLVFRGHSSGVGRTGRHPATSTNRKEKSLIVNKQKMTESGELTSVSMGFMKSNNSSIHVCRNKYSCTLTLSPGELKNKVLMPRLQSYGITVPR